LPRRPGKRLPRKGRHLIDAAHQGAFTPRERGLSRSAEPSADYGLALLAELAISG